MLKIHFVFVELVSESFLSISNSKFRRLGLPNCCFRMGSIANIDFSWKSILKNLGIDV